MKRKHKIIVMMIVIVVHCIMKYCSIYVEIYIHLEILLVEQYMLVTALYLTVRI
jgi:hypothetical protein